MLAIVGIGLGLMYLTWIFYLAVMNLARAKNAGKLTRVAYVLGIPLLVFGLVLDALLDWTVCTVLFFDLPEETLTTKRLKRYASGPDGWRKTLAYWFARHLLDVFDPDGKHI
jgi:hypothetical protein